MRKHILLSFILLSFVLTFSSTAFAQYKIEDLMAMAEFAESQAIQVVSNEIRNTVQTHVAETRMGGRVQGRMDIVERDVENSIHRSFENVRTRPEPINNRAHVTNTRQQTNTKHIQFANTRPQPKNARVNQNNSYNGRSYDNNVQNDSVNKQSSDANDVFDGSYNTYYFLNETERFVYNLIYDSVANAEPTWSTKDKDIIKKVERDDVINALKAIRIDHAEFVWLEYKVISSCTKTSSLLKVEFAYNKLADNPKLNQQKFEEAANRLLNWAREEGSLVDMEKYLFEYFYKYVKYGHNDLDQSGYGALVNKECVCGGVAIAFHYLMKKLGIPSYYVLGNTDGGGLHAWVLVKMNGKWYNVDATPNYSNSISQSIYDDYFNVPYGHDFWATVDKEYFPASRFKD